MSAPAHWLTPEFLQTVGVVLLHFLWQGAALAVVAAAALAVARSAATRYLLAMTVLTLMLTAPAATFLVLHSSAHPARFPEKAINLTALALGEQVAKSFAAPIVPVIASRTSSALTILAELWFTGVMLLSLRTAGGFFLISRLRRRDAQLATGNLLEICRDLQDQLGITRAVRYCQSLRLDSPAVIGWFRPVVLLPVTALTGLTEAQLRAVVAHELAHVRRFDAFFNLFQITAETLLFFHPAVWWLNKRIHDERENCCDDVALAICGNPAEYARALTSMEASRAVPSFAMAANRGSLTMRVARLLGLSEYASARKVSLLFALVCLAAAVLAGDALIVLVRTAGVHALLASQAQASQATSNSTTLVEVPRATSHRLSAQNKEPKKSSSENPPQSQPPQHQSFIDGMRAEGFENLSADQLIALKTQGVTPQYIHEVRAEGLKPTMEEIIGMKVQGITPEYIRQIRSLKLDTSVNSLIAMKVQGVTPEYVAEMRKLGFDPDTHQLIGMKAQGVTPEYVRSLNQMGLQPSVGDLMAMKVEGIDGEYIRTIRAAGLNPDKNEWIAFKVQGITPDYIKSLQAAGLKVDARDAISAKVMGVTPEFIELARSHGFKNLDLKKLIQLKQAGVLE